MHPFDIILIFCMPKVIVQLMWACGRLARMVWWQIVGQPCGPQVQPKRWTPALRLVMEHWPVGCYITWWWIHNQTFKRSQWNWMNTWQLPLVTPFWFSVGCLMSLVGWNWSVVSLECNSCTGFRKHNHVHCTLSEMRESWFTGDHNLLEALEVR